MRYHRKPTIKQILALKYINEGLSKKAAMKKAGYSDWTSKNPKNNLMQKAGASLILEDMRQELIDAGLTAKYIADKFKQWLEAQKVEHSLTEPDRTSPDYDTQLKAFKEWKEYMHPKQKNDGVKRKMEITEFIEGTIVQEEK